MIKYLLFDLDGTLTESGEGIIRSVQYALDKLGIKENNTEQLRRFIGPPLVDSFMRHYGFPKEKALEAVEIYRERYGRTGIFENALYPGVEEMLQNLKAHGFILSVASSKPEHYVRQILDHFKITGYFDEIVGATMDGKRLTKTHVIDEALRRLDLFERKDEVLMIGDTEHDIRGAREFGIDCVVVTYGYGDPEKVKAEQPFRIVDSAVELTDYLLNLSSR